VEIMDKAGKSVSKRRRNGGPVKKQKNQKGGRYGRPLWVFHPRIKYCPSHSQGHSEGTRNRELGKSLPKLQRNQGKSPVLSREENAVGRKKNSLKMERKGGGRRLQKWFLGDREVYN